MSASASNEISPPETGYSVPVEILTALAQGNLTQREFLGVSTESLQQVTDFGYKLLEHRHYDKAKIVFDGLVALDPRIAYFHIGLATALRNLGEKDAALDEYEKAKQLDPDDITPHLNQAQMLLEAGRHRDARKVLETAKRLDPKSRHPLSGEARILWFTQIEISPPSRPRTSGRGPQAGSGAAAEKDG